VYAVRLTYACFTAYNSAPLAFLLPHEQGELFSVNVPFVIAGLE